MANEEKAPVVLLENPGGVVVAVTPEHAEALLASEEGFKKAPKGAKEGDTTDRHEEPVAAQNELVPNGSSEDEAKAVADAQGTPENLKAAEAADPTNTEVQPADEGDAQDETDGEENTTEGTQAPVENSSDDKKGKGAGRFFGRGNKK